MFVFKKYIHKGLPYPVSSDCFSGFGRHNNKVHDKEAVDAYCKLTSETIPKVAQSIIQTIDKLDGEAKPDELTTFLHNNGVNMRYLGLLAQHVSNDQRARLRIVQEMVVRVLKIRLRSLMRNLGNFENAAYERTAMEWLRIVTCNTGKIDKSAVESAVKDLWTSVIIRDILHKYFYELPGVHAGGAEEVYPTIADALYYTLGIPQTDISAVQQQANMIFTQVKSLSKKKVSDEAFFQKLLCHTLSLDEEVLRDIFDNDLDNNKENDNKYTVLVVKKKLARSPAEIVGVEQVKEELRIRQIMLGKYNRFLVSTLVTMLFKLERDFASILSNSGFQGMEYVEWVLNPNMPRPTKSMSVVLGNVLNDIAFTASRTNAKRYAKDLNIEKLYLDGLALLTYGHGTNHHESAVCAGNMKFNALFLLLFFFFLFFFFLFFFFCKIIINNKYQITNNKPKLSISTPIPGNLGVHYYKWERKFEQAADLLEYSYSVQRNKISIFSSKVCEVLYNLHKCYLLQNELGKAREFLEKSLAIELVVENSTPLSGMLETMQSFEEIKQLDQRWLVWREQPISGVTFSFFLLFSFFFFLSIYCYNNQNKPTNQKQTKSNQKTKEIQTKYQILNIKPKKSNQKNQPKKSNHN